MIIEVAKVFSLQTLKLYSFPVSWLSSLQACIRAMLLDLAVKSLYASRLSHFGLRNPVHLLFPDNRDKYFSPYAGSLE
jgi:hypothetical protein